jgi:sirohydrochlorin ferrochelatase
MEQDQFLRWNQPLIWGAGATMALLIAAHGERRPGASNESVMRIARAIRERRIVSEVAVGFINGSPTIDDALGGFAARKVIVYPLFASNGYFTRDRLVQLIDEASGDAREIEILPPLGHDFGLPALVVDQIRRVALENGVRPMCSTVVLLGHGSRRNPASRKATERIAREIAKCEVCRDVAVAFLEEPPHLDETAQSINGPAIVVGMFSGDGLHGARDAPRLVAQLGRSDVFYSGVIGSAPGIEKVVGCSVQLALAAIAERRDRTKVGDKGGDLPCYGAFEVRNGKIKVWRDCFDLAT